MKTDRDIEKTYPLPEFIQKLNRKQVRVRLAGFVSLIGKRMGFDVTANELKELFDAFAAARRKKPGTIDHHLPERSDTLAREIYTARTHWKLLQPRPEKNSA